MLIGIRTSLRIVPSLGRLHEWIAIEEDLYQLERVAPELLDYVMYRVGVQEPLTFRTRPQDEPFVRNQPVANSASADGAIYYAGTGLGRIVPDLHGIATVSLFVPPESPVRCLEDLADIPIGVGLHAGSHFATLRLLEEHLPPDRIVVENFGGPRNRLLALQNRAISVAALQDPAASIAEQSGFRRLAETAYRRLFWVHKDLDPHALACYFRVLRRAEELRAEAPDGYRALWERGLPADLVGQHDVARFGPGERLVFEPITRADVEHTLTWLDRWSLDPPITERSFDKLTVRVPV